MKIEENVARVKSEIAKIADREVKLVAATKTRSVEEILRAVNAGVNIIGENRPQELRDKIDLLPSGLEKHFIGHLQQNKIKYVVGKVSLIHSCDSLDLAAAVDGYCAKNGLVQDMLLEVNVGREESKHGFFKEELLSAIPKLKALDNVRFRGLMTVLPKQEDGVLRRLMRELKSLYDELSGEFDFIYLSAGMSDDYRLAIQCGSNMVRLGREIFGERRVVK